MVRIMRNRARDGRGRPPRPWLSHYDKQLFAYIIGLSKKHRVNPDRFLKKIAEARENKESTCKTLKIQCRGRTKDYSLYRITKKSSLVSQLRIPNYFLEKGFEGTSIFSLSSLWSLLLLLEWGFLFSFPASYKYGEFWSGRLRIWPELYVCAPSGDDYVPPQKPFFYFSNNLSAVWHNKMLTGKLAGYITVNLFTHLQ